MKKPRITCTYCSRERIITQSVTWAYKEDNFDFCTRTCAINWLEKFIKIKN